MGPVPPVPIGSAGDPLFAQHIEDLLHSFIIDNLAQTCIAHSGNGNHNLHIPYGHPQNIILLNLAQDFLGFYGLDDTGAVHGIYNFITDFEHA